MSCEAPTFPIAQPEEGKHALLEELFLNSLAVLVKRQPNDVKLLGVEFLVMPRILNNVQSVDEGLGFVLTQG